MANAWRTARVFISSTFRDMHSERDWLVKRVFPALRERLEPHRIHLVDIDLRWGVTADQADNDRALDLCLAQIDECRPFFIGILGERYGWVPEAYPEEAVTKYGWIQHQTGKSITELEILYGVLRKQDMQSRAFFFFRDPSFRDDVPKAKQADVLSESEEAANKLRDLKQEILGAGLPTSPFADYPCAYHGLKINWRIARRQLSEADRGTLEAIAADDIIDNDEYAQLPPHLKAFIHRNSVVYLDGLQEFGDRVETELWTSIRTELKLDDATTRRVDVANDALSEEADYHERFMESRLRVYVGRQRDLRDLTQFANDDDEVVCLVTGPPGSGKSALLARFLTEYRGQHPQACVIPTFVGASPASSTLLGLLRRLCRLLRQRFGFELPIPASDEELSTTFRTYLTLIPESERVLLVIDALNQLDEAHEAYQLHWLPEQLPSHVKVVVSCTTTATADPAAERILAQFDKRMVFSVDVHPLTKTERRQILHAVPSLSAKSLDETQVRLLLENPATANPLFLLVALEELRGFGSYEELNDRIQVLPRSGDTLTALFTQVIERLEVDVGYGLVERVLTLLAVARRGLSEGELQQLVEGFDPADNLFPLLRQVRSWLFRRGELLDFYHTSLAQAIRLRFLDDLGGLADAHRALADYFQNHELSARQVEELPWQLCEAAEWQLDEAEEWQRLYELLADLSFFSASWEADPWDIKRYWTRLEADSSLRIVDAYQSVIDVPSAHPAQVRDIATLLFETGHPRESLKLRERMASHSRATGDLHELQVDLTNQAQVLCALGDLDGALELLDEQEQICRELGKKDGWANSMNTKAQILYKRGEVDKAMTLFTQVEQISRELGIKDLLAVSLNNQAAILQTRGDMGGAMTLCKRQEQICRELSQRSLLASCLGNQAAILRDCGDFDGAMALHQQEEKIQRELGDKYGLSRTLGNQAMICNYRNDLNGAMGLLKQSEQICRELNHKDGLQATLNDMGAIHLARVELDAAMTLFKQVEQICRELGNQKDLATALVNQAAVVSIRGDREASLRLHKQAEQLLRKLESKGGLAQALIHQALLLSQMGRHEEASAIAHESSSILNGHGMAAIAERLQPAISAILEAAGNQ